MDSNPTPEYDDVAVRTRCSAPGILGGRTCRESPAKRFEFLFLTDQFGVDAKFSLIKLPTTDIAIGACSK
jgi:hypothetical protein